MQIFVLNKNPKISALLLFAIDFKRANKQILELGQILSTVTRNKYKIKNKNFYKSCFVNHPIVIWTGKENKNFLWALIYLKELLNIFVILRKKHHKTEIVYKTVILYKNTQLKSVFGYDLTKTEVQFCRCISNDIYNKNIFIAYKQYLFKKVFY
ncbi:MAG: hypothetical protein J6C50_02490 [Rickettsiales bacterium]|nr:hypothetical protein [Rickettsiales bacterium]